MKATKEEREAMASIDRMCSNCGKFAHIVIPGETKLCSKCYKTLEVDGS